MRKKLYIILLIMVLSALIVASIVLPILIINSEAKIPQPKFNEFDQQSDMTAVVQWKKISRAESYDIEYTYDNPQMPNASLTTGVTQSNFFPIERKKGVLSVRVRAKYKNKTSNFSDWIQLNINGIKLNAPTAITISDKLLVEWAEVRYRHYSDRKSVPLYTYDLEIKIADIEFNPTDMDTQNNYEDISTFILPAISSLYGNVEITAEVWDDVEISVSVRAVNYSKLGSGKVTTGAYQFVYEVYDESEVATASYVFTLQDYQRLK